jgi:HPt (histidine-containing phosphotransfer) domain-containing protein
MHQILDMSVVEELMSFSDEGDPELLLDLIRMFLEDGPEKVRAVQEGMQQGDLEKVERAAHSLKGSSGNLGARLLQETCEQLQLASRQHQVELTRRLTPELATNFAQAAEALRKLQASYSG